MATDVDICNLALGLIGDDATISSINPPEGSAQADHCARFYSMARDALLEMHPWGFATTRVALPNVTNLASEWLYAYAVPNDALNILAVLDPNALDDYSLPMNNPGQVVVSAGVGGYTPQPFELEAGLNGSQIIYTDQVNAVLRYTRFVTDTSQFSPLFTQSLVCLLGSYLAGPVLKGETGAAAAKSLLNTFTNYWFPRATVSDANQRRVQLNQNTSWIANR